MKRKLILFSIVLTSFWILSLCYISCGGDVDDDTPPTPTATPVPDPDIIPGVKLYELYILDEFSTCRALYGDPEISGGGYGEDGYYFRLHYFDEALLLSVLDIDDDREVDDTDIIIQIGVTFISNWTGTTMGGNGLGSPLQSIKDEFGECEMSGENILFCDYMSKGIIWWFDKDTYLCDQIDVYEPWEY